MTGPDDLTGYAVDRFGYTPFGQVLGSLLREVDLDSLHDTIDEYGLQAVSEQYLRTLIDDGTLYADEASAFAEEDRLLETDPNASPEVHTVTVADLADEFTRLGLIDPTTSCGS